MSAPVVTASPDRDLLLAAHRRAALRRAHRRQSSARLAAMLTAAGAGQRS
ncbi:hypothetical protein [Trujillonella endophytica]|uniref:Uncharacterized protein n=1 Tax=Trujillonella endophytica TaxID=673521 RepID=A0A1H8TXT0_9ACTN|nr:hypothetical protein [Trujillella endophytica]SEO95353.1 hypothetical protein SAMN05660991_02509 [Trujillella endophytica]